MILVYVNFVNPENMISFQGCALAIFPSSKGEVRLTQVTAQKLERNSQEELAGGFWC